MDLLSILKKYKIDSKNQALVLAVKNKDFDVVKYLVEECDVNVNAFNGSEFLQTAVEHDCFDITNYLIDNGAKIRHHSEYIIKLAVSHGNISLLETLGYDTIKTYANFIYQLAVDCCNVNIEEYMYYEYHCEVWCCECCDCGDSCECYNSCECCDCSSKDTRKMIHDDGNNVRTNEKNSIQKEIVVEEEEVEEEVSYQYELLDIFKRYQADDFKEALLAATSNNDLGIIKYLVKCGASIHFNNEEPLQIAIKNGNLKIVKYLVEEYNCDIHVNNEELFRIAVFYKRFNIIRYLIKYECENSIKLNTKLINTLGTNLSDDKALEELISQLNTSCKWSKYNIYKDLYNKINKYI